MSVGKCIYRQVQNITTNFTQHSLTAWLVCLVTSSLFLRSNLVDSLPSRSLPSYYIKNDARKGQISSGTIPKVGKLAENSIVTSQGNNWTKTGHS